MSKLVTRFALLNAVVGIACSDLPPPPGSGTGGGGGAGPSGGSAGASAASGTSFGGSSGTGPVPGGAAGSATGGSMAGAPAGAGGVAGGAGTPGGAPQGGLGGANGGMGGGGMSGAGGAGTGGAGGGGVSGAGAGAGGTNTGGTGGAGTGGAGMGGAGTGGAGAGGAAMGGGGKGGAGTAGASGGGSGGTAGNCGRPVGACTAPTVRVTDVPVGVAVTGYGNEGDTLPLPMAIAAKPSGGSRIAWLGTNQQIYVGELDCEDRLVGTPFTLPAIDLQDIHADDNGGVVLLTREATNGGQDNCGTGTLCGGSSSPCRTMWLVRFNASGQVQWQTQVTNLTTTLAGYQNNARFIWWYQHHGRLAFDGTNYAAYFGVAITVNNGACVDIHEGDRMQVVSGSGTLIANHADSFAVGCSHSWTSRIVWDPRTSHFVSVCATDNNCRIARPNPYRTIAAGACDGTLFGGDLVLSTNPGYWTAWSQGGTIRLQHFTDSGPDTAIANAGSSQHPHLVPYGTSRMLLTWGSGASMTAQVRDAGATAATIGSTFTIAVNDHSYHAFKPYADGSVAYPAAGANNTSLKIARVMPCN